jgi:hypothetical protein
VKRTQIVLGVGVRALGILSVCPGLRATEPPDGDTNSKPIGEAFAPDVGAPVSSPFQTTEKLSLGAVTESPSEAAEADKLAKQLSNPISSILPVV